MPSVGTAETSLRRAANGAAPSSLVALMHRVAARDRAAFAALYDATSAKLYGILLRILRRRDVADEVLQEAYVQIWERAASYDAAKGSPIAWMAAIARNRALDEVRRRRPQLVEDASDVENIASDDVPALDGLERSEELQRLRQCLDRLDAERREVVLLAYCDGLTREALGQRLARPAGTIKSWLRRSLLQLRDCLSQ